MNLYARMAVQNIKKNHRFFIPRILTEAGLLGCFYIVYTLYRDERMRSVYGGQYLPFFMFVGISVVTLLSVILMLYTNSFLMKQRKREFGLYNVPGLKNVQLDNKGTNYIGKPGARARCIFDGEVTAVFQFSGTKNVLVRHGSYISVYCNLSSVIVSKGQQVHAKDILGTVADDGSGNCVLHFQLRKETAKLNPEAWIGK